MNHPFRRLLALLPALFLPAYLFGAETLPPLSLTPSWTAEGEHPEDDFGFKVAWAGDVYGDGYDCVLVSAPGYDLHRGKVYLYRGGPGGLSKDPVWTAEGEAGNDGFGTGIGGVGDLNGDGYADIFIDAPTHSGWWHRHAGKLYVYYGGPQGLPSSPSWVLQGDQKWEDFGDYTSAIGDITGSGYCDLAVGAYNWDHSRGKTRIYYGGPSGLSDKPAWEKLCVAPFHCFDGLVCPAAGTPVPSDEKPVWEMKGEAQGDQFAYSLGPAGDVRGSGYCDVLVGAKFHDRMKGKAYLLAGSASGVHGLPVWSAVGENPFDTFGQNLFSAGDVNGRGYSGVVIGAPGWKQRGAVYVFQGGPSGLSEKPSWSIHGGPTDHSFGHSVACAGDVGNSGYSSVIIGAPESDNTVGRAYLYLGSSGGLLKVPAWKIQGENSQDRYGQWVAGAGDVNGDGFADVLVGAGGYDHIRGKAYLYLGNGGRPGFSVCPGQFKTDGSRRIGPMGMAGPGMGVLLKLRAQSPLGNCRVKPQAELKPVGHAFDGSGIISGGSWVTIGSTTQGVELTCWHLKPQTAYRWRLRLLYELPRFNHGRKTSAWLKPSNALLSGGCDFRTPPSDDGNYLTKVRR